MVTDTAKVLAQAQLAATNGTIYTVPASTTARVTQIFITNTHSSALTFRLHHVLSAGSVGASNALYYDVTIQPNQTVPVEELFMATGDTLQGLASTASKITITIYGIERS